MYMEFNTQNFKNCNKCLIETNYTQFYQNQKAKDWHWWTCKKCIALLRKWQWEVYSRIILDVKDIYWCFQCDEKLPHRLSLHHINPKIKKFTISSAKYAWYSFSTMRKEIEKCVVLCHNCHSDYHFYDNLKDKTVQSFLDDLYVNIKI